MAEHRKPRTSKSVNDNWTFSGTMDMSLFNSLQTSVTGMNIQARRMESVSGNIANSSTTGYKRVSTEFETQVIDQSARNFTSGGAIASTRYYTSEQGDLRSSANVTDLAVKGNGFFVVTDASGVSKLTRAGAFLPDENGDLKNTAGLFLMGLPIDGATQPNTIPAIGELKRVSLKEMGMTATATTSGDLSVNLPSASTIQDGSLPTENTADAKFSVKTSQVFYDNLGAAKTLDFYYTKTADNTWEVAVFDAAGRTNGGFPYSSGPITSQTLQFDPANGSLLSPQALQVAVPGGQSVNVDISSTTQLAAGFNITHANHNGSAPGSLDHIEIDSEGILSYINSSGARVNMFKIPLANAISPNNLRSVAGNAYVESANSGAISLISAAQGAGEIRASTLEASTVDLASELTTMIDAQRSYSANSKSFKTSSDMMEVLMSLRS